MPHSTLGSKGRTTIPRDVRRALGIRPGDRLEYEVADGGVSLRVQPGLMALRGALASDRGKGMSFAQIRAAAAAPQKRRRTVVRLADQ